MFLISEVLHSPAASHLLLIKMIIRNDLIHQRQSVLQWLFKDLLILQLNFKLNGLQIQPVLQEHH